MDYAIWFVAFYYTGLIESPSPFVIGFLLIIARQMRLDASAASRARQGRPDPAA